MKFTKNAKAEQFTKEDLRTEENLGLLKEILPRYQQAIKFSKKKNLKKKV